jgi:hypothetical protein
MTIKIQRAKGKYGKAYEKEATEYDVLQVLDISDTDGFFHGLTISKEDVVRIVNEIKETFPELFVKE